MGKIDINEITSPYIDREKFIAFFNPKEDNDAVLKMFRALHDLGPQIDYYPYKKHKPPVEDIPDLHNTEFLTIDEIRTLVSLKFVSAMEAKFPRSARAFSEKTGFSNSTISKLYAFKNSIDGVEEVDLPNGGKRLIIVSSGSKSKYSVSALGAAPSILINIANTLFSLSVHEMFLNTKGVCVLPSMYSVLALGMMETFSVGDFKKCLSLGRKMADKAGFDAKDQDAYYPKPVLVRDRFLELTEENEKTRNIKYVLTDDTGGEQRIKNYLKAIDNVMSENVDEGDSNYCPQIDFFIFSSLLTGFPIDYFIKPDFIEISGGLTGTSSESRTTIKAKKGSELIDVVQPDVLRVLSLCFGLKGEDKISFISYVMSILLCNEYNP